MKTKSNAPLELNKESVKKMQQLSDEHRKTIIDLKDEINDLIKFLK